MAWCLQSCSCVLSLFCIWILRENWQFMEFYAQCTLHTCITDLIFNSHLLYIWFEYWPLLNDNNHQKCKALKCRDGGLIWANRWINASLNIQFMHLRIIWICSSNNSHVYAWLIGIMHSPTLMKANIINTIHLALMLLIQFIHWLFVLNCYCVSVKSCVLILCL